MSNVSIGVTAMELFAYNPFRMLGIPVDSTRAEIDKTYNKLQKLADSGDIGGYTTSFDFSSLPPFSRSGQTIKTAYAKLASNGYRCFAYSDSQFSVSLNIDDIALNLRDITCYDCFLRCYMWLIINDREMQEHDLWIHLAKYIDKMIMSSPEEWTKYFDHRFPDEMIDPSHTVYKSFYNTFCEIILLPLKEMVRGSMKCRSAAEILQCAKIDINEQFEYIDIPQANKPKPGEPEPKLKIALKDGEEYFDIKTGQMKSYSTDTEAAESNSFAGNAVAPLSAQDIIDDTPAPEETAYEDQPQEPYAEKPESQASIPAPEPSASRIPERRAPERRVSDRKADGAPAPKTERKAPPKPTEPVAPKPEPLKLDGAQQPAPTPPPAPSAPPQKRSFRSSVEKSSDTPRASSTQQNADFSSGNPFFKIGTEVKPEEAVQPKRAAAGGFTDIVKEAEKKEEEAYENAMMEEEENLFTNALIEMLKSNQARGETMKSVDTRNVKLSEKDLTTPSPSKVSMSDINMDKYDEKLLASNNIKVGEKLTREERYRNIKIDDMLGTNNPNKGYAPSVVEEYQKMKKKEKENIRSIFVTVGVFAICLLIFAAMWYFGII